jgi:hypothetical protein
MNLLENVHLLNVIKATQEAIRKTSSEAMEAIRTINNQESILLNEAIQTAYISSIIIQALLSCLLGSLKTGTFHTQFNQEEMTSVYEDLKALHLEVTKFVKNSGPTKSLQELDNYLNKICRLNTESAEACLNTSIQYQENVRRIEEQNGSLSQTINTVGSYITSIQDSPNSFFSDSKPQHLKQRYLP